jgi:hypothetical protein
VDTVRTLIRLSGEEASLELVELAAWLTSEDELRGRVTVRSAAVSPGEMGGGIADVLIVALGAQGVGTVLAASLSTWIKHRRPSADIEITDEEGRSTKISIRDATPDTVDAVVRRALER